MENASKALLIAGAILIAILLIALGMMAYTAGKSQVDKSQSNLDATQVTAFNEKWTQYEGAQGISGSEVRSLMNLVETNNANADNPTVTVTGIGAVNSTATNTTARTTPAAIRNAVNINNRYVVTCTRGGANGLVSNIHVANR